MHTGEAQAAAFRPVPAEDAAQAMGIIRDAQAMMKAEGRDQWQNGYPALSDILEDIKAGNAYGLYYGRDLVCYGAVIFGGEPTYKVIEGEWLGSCSYVAVHRLAVSRTCLRKGLASAYLRETLELASSRGTGSCRIDTNHDNSYMLKLLEKEGFVHCGTITLADGGKRLAFEKLL